MKTLLFGLALAGAVSTANAQVYVPQSVANGAVVGGIAGAIIGGHNNDRWGEGAIIGAAAGALLGAVVNQEPQRVYGQPTAYPSYPAPPTVYTPPAPASAWPTAGEPIEPARVVPPAPVYGEPVYTYPQPTPTQTVVYVERPAPPQVVYVERPAPPRVIYVEAPVRYYPRVVRVVPPPAPPRRERARALAALGRHCLTADITDCADTS